MGMFKKFMAAALAIAVVVAMWIVPAGATDTDVVLDLNYGSKSWKNESAVPAKTLPIVNDYDGNFTMELYVKIDDFTTPSVIAGAFGAALHGYALWVYGGTMYFSAADSGGNNHVTVASDITANWVGKWLHVLCVKNGTTNTLYCAAESSDEYWTASTNRTNNRVYTDAVSFGINGGGTSFAGAASFTLGTVRMYNADKSADKAALRAECAARLEEATKPPKAEAPLILKSKPEKLSYVIGEELDTTGLAVATKADGVLTDVDLAQCTITGFDSTAAGTSVVTVSYETEDTIYTNKFTVKITAPVSLSSIVLAAKPSKLIYEAGEALDTTGLAITAKYSDGSTALISEGLTVTGYEATTAGVQRLTVAYGEFEQTTSFSVRVKAAPEVRQIVLASKPAKLYYANGEALDVSGLTVKAKYTDGSTAIIEAADLTVTGYDATAAGVQRLTVAYGEFAQTTSFSVRVAEAEFSDQIIFNVDFRDETYVEQVRNITPSLNGTTFLGYVDANGGKVADLSSPTHLSYEIPTEVYTAMQDSYTMEIYVNITDGNNANLGFIAGDTGWLAPNGVTFWVRSIANGGMLFGKGTEISVGEMASPDKYLEGGQKGQWNHLVYVHDGDTGSYYVNGVLAGTQTVTTTQHDTTAGFHIGAYAGDGNFAALGQYSFVKVYGAAATADQVAALYAAR